LTNQWTSEEEIVIWFIGRMTTLFVITDIISILLTVQCAWK